MMINFMVALQPLDVITGEGKVMLVCTGRANDANDAEAQCKTKYRELYPAQAELADASNNWLGATFVFNCSIWELIEKAADNHTKKLIQRLYDMSIELTPILNS